MRCQYLIGRRERKFMTKIEILQKFFSQAFPGLSTQTPNTYTHDCCRRQSSKRLAALLLIPIILLLADRRSNSQTRSATLSPILDLQLTKELGHFFNPLPLHPLPLLRFLQLSLPLLLLFHFSALLKTAVSSLSNHLTQPELEERERESSRRAQ